MLELDHVIFVVDGLDDAAAEMAKWHGLASVPGGRHPGHGTGNRIVPLGASYLELMAVVDAAAATESPLGRWAARSTRSSLEPAALCVRTDDIDRIAAALEETPLAMARETEEGEVLSWRLAGLGGMLEKGDPFFIQWDVASEHHPGATAIDHPISPRALSEVRHGWPSGDLPGILGDVDGLFIEDGIPGVHAVTVTTARGSTTFPTRH